MDPVVLLCSDIVRACLVSQKGEKAKKCYFVIRNARYGSSVLLMEVVPVAPVLQLLIV